MITYDPKTKRYYKDGKEIAPRDVSKAFRKAMVQAEKEMRGLGESLTSGEVEIDEWQDAMSGKAKAILIIAALFAFGGKSQMTAARWGKVGENVREQNEYLNNFARQISLGQVSPAQIINRSALYAKRARTLFFGAAKDAETAGGSGKLEARRLINSKEGCPECAEVAAMDWIDADEMPDIGSLICKDFCLCEVEFREKIDG